MSTHDKVTSITDTDKIVVLDLELLADVQLYARYVKLDPRPSRRSLADEAGLRRNRHLPEP